jgi:hypothetical protein
MTRHLGAALTGGLLALLIIAVAPATSARVGGSPADLSLAASAAVATAANQVARLIRYFPLTILLCLVVPGVLGARCHVDKKLFLVITACVAITLPFCYFPSFYAQNGNPPARSLIVPEAILIGYLLFVGFARARLLEAIPRHAAVALALALVPIGIAVATLPEQASAAEYAALWDAEDQQIRASRDAGQTDVTVHRLPRYLGENFVTPDRGNWFNQCVARYYGVRSIATPS